MTEAHRTEEQRARREERTSRGISFEEHDRYKRCLYRANGRLIQMGHDPEKLDYSDQAAADVLAERRRQVTAEGWTSEHDDEHDSGQLAIAAATYALRSARFRFDIQSEIWPWSFEWWKPSDPRRNLVKAAALILAEIERLDRASGKQSPEEPAPEQTPVAQMTELMRLAQQPVKASADDTCHLCGGSGTIEVPDEVGPNAYPMDMDCPRCKGTGAQTSEKPSDD